MKQGDSYKWNIWRQKMHPQNARKGQKWVVLSIPEDAEEGGLKNSKNIQVTTSDIYPWRNVFKSRQKTILSN